MVVQANWRDNPFFPPCWRKSGRLDLRLYPDRYEHIWEGDYARALDGAYFARQLAEAKAEGRIGGGGDPLLPVRAFFDMGGTAPAPTPWRSGSPMGRTRNPGAGLHRGFGPGAGLLCQASCGRGAGARRFAFCPMTGSPRNITGKRYEDHVREAGFEAMVIPNQGRGAAMMRIEAARRLFAAHLVPRSRDGSRARRAGLLPRKQGRDPQRRAGAGA